MFRDKNHCYQYANYSFLCPFGFALFLIVFKFVSVFPSTFSVMLILGGSLTTSLLLVNVLIAQLSESYAVAKSNAILHYDVARLKFVTRIENSRFKFMVIFNLILNVCTVESTSCHSTLAAFFNRINCQASP